MTTILVPYTCSQCKNKIDVTMKVGEPLIPRTCSKCGGTALAPDKIEKDTEYLDESYDVGATTDQEVEED